MMLFYTYIFKHTATTFIFKHIRDIFASHYTEEFSNMQLLYLMTVRCTYVNPRMRTHTQIVYDIML